MIKRLLLIVIILSTVLVGQNKVPDIRLTKLNGQPAQLYSYLKEGPVLINFWATWCAPCKKEMVYLNQFEKKYANQGFSILSISTDSPKTLSSVRSYIRAKKYTFDVFIDPNRQIFKQLNGNLMPTNILVGQDGSILWRHYGYLPGDEKNMEIEIKTALKLTS